MVPAFAGTTEGGAGRLSRDRCRVKWGGSFGFFYLTLRIISLALILGAWALFSAGCIFGGESERDLSQYFPPPPQEGAQQTQDQAAGTRMAIRRLSRGRRRLAGIRWFRRREELENLEVAPPTRLLRGAEFLPPDRNRRPAQRLCNELQLKPGNESPSTPSSSATETSWAEATIRGFTWSVSDSPGRRERVVA